MDSRIQLTTTLSIDYSDVGDIIKENFGHPFEFQVEEECCNDTAKTYVFKKKKMGKYEMEEVKEFIQTGTCDSAFMSLWQHLVNTDVVPEGEYVINVCW